MMSSPQPQVSLKAVWFLLAIVVLTLLIIIFYLYFSKKVCFKSCRGCDGILEPGYLSANKALDHNAFTGDVVAQIKMAEVERNISETHSLSASDDSLCDYAYQHNDDVIIEEDNLNSQGAGDLRTSNSSLSVDVPLTLSQRFRNSMQSLRTNLTATSKSTSIRTLTNPATYDAAKHTAANSFDESDSDTSSDSDEETFRNIQKTIKRSNVSISRMSSTHQSPNSAKSHPSHVTPSHNASISDSMNRPHADDDTYLMRNQDNQEVVVVSASASSINEQDWTLGDVGSIYSRDMSSSLMEDDEIAAAIAVKPLRSDEESDGDDDGESTQHPPISSCGTLDIAVQYSLTDKKLQITIVDAKDLPSKDRGGSSIIQVRAVMLPAKRKRYKTKVQHINSPHFAETFKLSHITPEDLKGLGLRLRLYGIGKVRDRLIGEATVRFDELNLIRDPQLTVTLQLEPRTDVNRGDLDISAASQSGNDVPSVATLAHGGSLPEILLSMSYNEMTGRLSVEVVKGSHFRNLAMAKPPDTHVKLVLLNSGYQEMAQSKTTIRRSQPNPVFRETFYFQVALFQLAEVSLMVSVYCNRTIKRKSMLGWISMGRNSSSESDEQHWLEMREAKGKVVSRWHTLIES